MCLTAVPLIGTKLEPLVISSTQFSTALVTGVPHFFNNTMLSHSAQSKLANVENYTAEHSTRQTHTTTRPIWQLNGEENSPSQSNVLVSWKASARRMDIKRSQIMVSHSTLRITINNLFCHWVETLINRVWRNNLMNMDIKLVSHDSSWTTRSAYFGNSTLYWYAGQ